MNKKLRQLGQVLSMVTVLAALCFGILNIFTGNQLESVAWIALGSAVLAHIRLDDKECKRQ